MHSGCGEVGVSTYTPMEGNNDGYGIQMEGQPNLHKSASEHHCECKYFDSVGTHVLRGAGLPCRTRLLRRRFSVVNEDLSRRSSKPGENRSDIASRLGEILRSLTRLWA